METLSASDARREFGEVLLKAQKGPVGINRNGKPVAVMVSAETFDELQAVQQAALQQAIDDGMADIKAGNMVEGDEVFSRLRKQAIAASGGLRHLCSAPVASLRPARNGARPQRLWRPEEDSNL